MPLPLSKSPFHSAVAFLIAMSASLVPFRAWIVARDERLSYRVTYNDVMATTTVLDLARPGGRGGRRRRAQRRLAAVRARAAPAWRRRWPALASAVRATPLERWTAADPYLALLVHRAVLDARAAADDERARRAADRARAARATRSRRSAEAEEVGDARTPKELARWLAGALEVPQRDLAALLGVDLRRFQRWISARERTQPEGEEARRAARLARLVAPAPPRLHARGRARVVRLAAAGARRRDAARAAAPTRSGCPSCCSPPARRGAPRSRDGGAGRRVPARVVAAAAADGAEPRRRALPPRHRGVADAVPLPAPARAVGGVPAREPTCARPSSSRSCGTGRGRCGSTLDGLPRIGFAEAAEHGLRPGDLVSDDLRACHRLADRLRAAGAPGAIVPSAALPGTDNVVLFGERAASPYLVDPLGRGRRPGLARPRTAAGRRSACSTRVRRRGAPHAALEAWRAGEPFRFREPSWALP